LWRLRRANAIETDLFELHAEGLGMRQLDVGGTTRESDGSIELRLESSPRANGGQWQQSNGDQFADQYKTSVRHLTQSFLRLAELDSRAFERLNRYEVALWRQTRQTLNALHPRRYR
jgi:hypothetical protein